MQETQVQSLVWEDSLEEEMAAHSSTLAWDWEIPWTESLVGYSPWGFKRVGHDLGTKQQLRSEILVQTLSLALKSCVSSRNLFCLFKAQFQHL